VLDALAKKLFDNSKTEKINQKNKKKETP